MAQLKDTKLHYVICGIGPEEENLRALAKSLGLESQLHLLGYRRDIPRLLAAADLYAFPSLQEGLPVALMEAMAAGKAVVASRIRGNDDLLEGMPGGVLVDAHDVEGFAKAMSALLSDRERCHSMGESNRLRIREFDRNVVDAKMKTLYQEISQ